jgi:ABC-2 type transport system ATP-binding protein
VDSAPSSTPLVRVRGLAKHYGRLAALTDVSFRINRAEVLGVIGPNGSGKTTLFECMGGMLAYDAGSIEEEGRTRHAGDRSSTVFYLPDSVAPWPHERVTWALDYMLGLFGGNPSARGDVVEALDLAPLLGTRIGVLSKGQRKRALLGCGLLTPHAVLLADEPFDGLDLRQTREVAAALRAYAARGRTLCLSIHQIADAARVCDRFVLLSGGRVCGEGTLDQLSTRAARRDPSAVRSSLEEVFLALT